MVPFALRPRVPLAAFMQQGIGTAAPVHPQASPLAALVSEADPAVVPADCGFL